MQLFQTTKSFKAMRNLLNTIIVTIHNDEGDGWVKAHYNGLFWMSQFIYFLGQSNLIAYNSNEFEKYGKNEIIN